MAVNPTGPQIERRPPTRPAPRTERAATDPRALPRSPRSASRLATAISESEIARQLSRLAALLTGGEIDMSAPRGSYLNFLV
ncbi:MAG: hypothetical protein OHK0024_31980 [Thalassobaculales bacterium]